jgi:uncharacterized protein (TIGR00255 family)
MTGFGKATTEIPGKKINVEIRCLNSKQLDINAKMPWIYREKEIEIREIIQKSLERGKIDLSIFVDLQDDHSAPTINKEVVKSYYNQLKEVTGELYIDSDEQLLSVIMRLPETLRTEKEALTENEWEILSGLITDAIQQADKYRLDEGRALDKDIRFRIDNITTFLKEIEPFEQERIEKYREKILTALDSFSKENVDMNRFEQELIFYIEKLDINEEKVRLRKHCEYFLETIDSDGFNGKKMGFITQEIGREINTIGSKANDATIQGIVVRMKDELEKVKEQVLNIL